MFGFLVGWGVFWLLLWLFVFWVGHSNDNSDWEGAGVLFGAISVFYLVAVCVGRLVI